METMGEGERKREDNVKEHEGEINDKNKKNENSEKIL